MIPNLNIFYKGAKRLQWKVFKCLQMDCKMKNFKKVLQMAPNSTIPPNAYIRHQNQKVQQSPQKGNKILHCKKCIKMISNSHIKQNAA